MKKLLGLALTGIMCAVLAGCTTAGADEQGVRMAAVDESISLEDGYYINDKDDTYIRIEGNRIELCGLDYDAYAEEKWNEVIADLDETELEKQLPQHETFVKNTADDARLTFSLQEFVPVTFTLPNHKSTVLALNYVKDSQTYEGYSLKDDNSIVMIGNIYRYYGTELPQ